MRWGRDSSGDPGEHWMTTGRRGDQPVPATVLARWQWYREASRRNRLRYGTLEIVAIVASAAIPIGAAAGVAAAVIAALGGVVLVATAARATFGVHENWVEFSQIHYAIERESALYFASVAPYDTDDAPRQLVMRVETLSEDSGQRWAVRRLSLEHAQQSNAKAEPVVTPPAAG